MTDLRACTKCGSTQNGFHKNTQYRDGLHPYCKVCRRELANKRLESESHEKKQQRKLKASLYRSKKETKERQAQYIKEWRVKNRSKFLISARKADAKRAPGRSDYQRQWRAKNREVVAMHSRNRRAIVKNSAGSHTAGDIQWLLNQQRYQCAVCKKNIRGCYHVDHIEPLAKGGSNDKSNLQVLCPTCNNQKHASDPVDFMQRKGFLL